MQNYQHGSVVLLALPFSDTATFKLRPALILLDTADDDIVVSRITSQMVKTAFDVEIQRMAASRVNASVSSSVT